ncbi:MAG: S1 family peptidase [Acidobacteriota bacterium]|nr:S1 family peptidase [Acidobacteriota bacterium]
MTSLGRNRKASIGLLLGLILILGSVSANADESLWVESDGVIGIPGERFEGGIDVKARTDRARPLRPDVSAPIALEMRLEPVSLPEKDAVGETRIGVPKRIGVHRQMPAEWRVPIQARDLLWEPVAGGGEVATFSLTSPGALSLRLAIDFEVLPKGAEIRFYSPDDPSDAMGPYEAGFILPARAKKKGRSRHPFWSPVIQGESIAMELFVPGWDSGQDVVFSIDRVSHNYLPLTTSFLKGPGDSGSCNRNLSCSNKWQDAGDGVAMYVFEGAGFSAQCSGQLIVDGDASTQKSWFLTAAHCVSKRSEARTMALEFFYQQASCGGGAISTAQLGGGATLKATTGNGGTVEGDTTLVRVKRDLPAGVFFQGLSIGGDHVGTKRGASIGHPNGDHKKIALLKRVHDVVKVDSGGFLVDGNTHYEVTWRKGTTTEGGSSGSSLMVGKRSPKQFVIGVLTGGAAACGNAFEDYYGSFDYVLDNFSKFRKQLSLN